MKQDKKLEDSRPHFVDATYPEDKPWITNIYFGQRDRIGSHAHLSISGAAIWYLRDINGQEIVKNGKRIPI